MVVMRYTTTANVEPEHVSAYLDDGWTIVDDEPSFSERGRKPTPAVHSLFLRRFTGDTTQ